MADVEKALLHEAETQPACPEPKPSLRQRLLNTQLVILNTTATIAVVFLNKYILTDPQLQHCQLSLAAWHFLATFLVLFLATRRPFRLFAGLRIPALKILPLAGFFSAFLLLNNLSLALNPVGFYQLSKIMTTPCVVLLNFALFHQKIPGGKLLSVIVTCLGVALTTTTALESNPVGAVMAVAAFVATACYQIWIGKKVVELEVTPAQLLLNQAPAAVVLLLPLIPFTDTVPHLEVISREALLSFIGSGFVASLINLSQFLLIARTSALTFNIVSHLKSIAILSLGWYMDGKIFQLTDIVGIALAVGGAWAYSMPEKRAPAPHLGETKQPS